MTVLEFMCQLTTSKTLWFYFFFRLIDVNAKALKGNTALLFAANKNIKGTIIFLLEKGAGNDIIMLHEASKGSKAACMIEGLQDVEVVWLFYLLAMHASVHNTYY